MDARSGFTRSSKVKAFSLIEVVLALGVISVALVGILGLFPVTMGAARESQQETQAAFIARTIYNDLLSAPPRQTFIALSSAPLSKGGGSTTLPVDLASPSTHYIAYTPDGLPDGQISQGTFENGRPQGGFLVTVRASPSTEAGQESISRLEILVEAPGTLPVRRRESYPFVTLVNNGRVSPAP